MKIEKLSENQIRCTLTKLDLNIRQMELRELTYGSENARNLFREMIQQASSELDFHVDDIPIMVEAIPVFNDGVILLITKIEDPEELDTRFSSFTQSMDDDPDSLDFANLSREESEGLDEILNSYETLQESKSKSAKGTLPYPEAPAEEKESKKDTFDASQINMVRSFRFKDLDTVSEVSFVLKDIYFGENSLYKDEKDGLYYLVVNKPPHSPLEYNRICNILTEYGTKIKNTYSSEPFYQEHYKTIIKKSALQILAEI